MSKNPLLDNIPLIKNLTECAETIDGMIDRIRKNTKRKDDVYDQRLFLKKLQLDSFRVDGFAAVTFIPTITNIDILNNKEFRVTANEMPDIYNHTQSVWEVSLSPTFTSVLKTELSNPVTLNQHTFIFTELPYDTTFYFRVKYHTDIAYTDWSSIVSKKTKVLAMINKPIITGNILNLKDITLNGNAYYHEDLPQTSSIWEFSDVQDFSSTKLTRTTTTNLQSINYTFSDNLITGKNYYARVMYTNKLLESEWSDVITLTLSNITKPTIDMVTLQNATTFNVVASNFSHSKLTHTGTIWEFSNNSNYNSPIITKTDITPTTSTSLILNTVIPLDDDITYYFRVKYFSDTAESPWSDSKIINIVNIETPTILTANIINNTTFQLTSSNFVHSLLSHKETTWQISDKNDFSNLLYDYKDNINLLGLTTIIPEQLKTGISYFIRNRYHSDLVESEWSTTKELIFENIEKPIISEVIIDSNDDYKFKIFSSNFHHDCLTHTSSTWEVSFLSSFDSKITTTNSDINLTSINFNLNTFLKANTNYYFRVKYFAGYLASEFSETFIFKTNPIPKPVILSNTLTQVDKRVDLTSSLFTYMNLIHDKTVWEVSLDNFITTLDTKTVELPNDLNNITFIIDSMLPETDYYFRVKYFSGTNNESVWSDVLKITTGTNGAIETPTIYDPGLLCPYNFTLTSSDFVQTGDITQTKAIWQICDKETFNINDPSFHEVIVDINSDTPFTMAIFDPTWIVEGTQYYIRVKYLSEPV